MQKSGENSSEKELFNSFDGFIFNKKGASTDASFLPLCKYLLQNYNRKPPKLEPKNITPIEYKSTDLKVIAFSGGATSLACAMRYVDAGYPIILFHVSYPGEDLSAIKEMSEMLGVPLYVCEIDYFSRTNKPTDSAVIIKEAVKYILSEGFSHTLIYGYFDSNSIYDVNRDEACHCKEFINCYRNLVRRLIPDFDIINPLPNKAIVWDELIRHKAYIRLLRASNVQEHRILENTKMDFRLEEAVSSIYMRNFKLLSQAYIRKKGRTGTVIEVWNEFFNYRIETSKFYAELMKSSC